MLFVCTGNVCRSPVAEKLLRARLPAESTIVCSSAGVSALTGRPIDPPSVTVLRELGADPHGHIAKRLTYQQVQAADLILTAEVSHRTVVLQLEPLAFRRTFTMLEFGRLGSGLSASTLPLNEQDLRARVDEVAGQRGLVDTVPVGADDISDPFGRNVSAARTSALAISASIDTLVRVLGISSRKVNAR